MHLVNVWLWDVGFHLKGRLEQLQVYEDTFATLQEDENKVNRNQEKDSWIYDIKDKVYGKNNV